MSSSFYPGVNEDLPLPERWVGEETSYAPEHLTLPDAEEAHSPDALRTESRRLFADDFGQLRLMSEKRVALNLKSPGPAEDDGARCWFRWIAGHQVSFIVWRLLASAVAEIRPGPEPVGNAIQAATQYLSGYSAMLLYTSSCPREVYETLIRPSMYRQHPGFSGGWAPDYKPIRELLRGRIPPAIEQLDAAGEVRRAVRLSHLIHEAVAAKLVPNGRSLLQQSGFSCRNSAEDLRQLGALYDDYFMTLRAPVSHVEVVAQLMRRLNVIARDVAANGLETLVTDEDKSDHVHTAGVALFETEFFKTCARVASFAAGFTDEMVVRQEWRAGVAHD